MCALVEDIELQLVSSTRGWLVDLSFWSMWLTF